MKLHITRSELLLALTNVVGVVEKKSTIQVLSNILLEAKGDKLTVSGTDLELEAKDTVGCQVDREGAITTPADKLLSATKTLKKDAFVILETTENGLLFKSGKKEMVLNIISADDYPLLDAIENAIERELNENEVAELINTVSHSMANNDVRYFLNGLYLDFSAESLNAVSTDGHRLTLNSLDIKSETQQTAIVPRKAVLELTKLLDPRSDDTVKLSLSDNRIQINRGSFQLTSKLIDGRYPDYLSAIPNNINHRVKVDREDFKSALDFVSVTANEKFKVVRLKFTDGNLEVKANNPNGETGSSDVECDYYGDEFEIGFNIIYLQAAISQSHDEFINIGLQDSTRSVTITYDCSDAQHIVMPVRL